MKVLLNVSGHALSESASTALRGDFDKIETLDVGLIDFSESVEPQIREIFSASTTPLDGSVSVSVILPGHPVVAVLSFIFLHGTLGYFPNVCVLEQSDEGPFTPTTMFSVDTRTIRLGGRSMRSAISQDKLE